VNDLVGAKPKGPVVPMEIYEDPPEILAYDPDLDSGTLPPPRGLDPEPPEDDEDDIRDEDITVEEVRPLDPFRNSFALQLASMRNNGPEGDSRSFWAAGLRYGLRLSKRIFANRPKLQDSLTLEGGLFMYKAMEITEGESDSYTIVPIVGTVRYTLLFGETFGMFAYGGAVLNQVVASTNEQEAAMSALNSALPAFGLGMLFQIGPQWEIRTDFGLDMIGAGLVLRF
jgi:hypothetical protein